MDPFSQPTAAAAYSALSSKAQSAALEIQLRLPTEARAQDALQKQLSSLSIRLQQFAHHASQLGHCVADAAVVYQPFGDVLSLSLTKCQDGLGMVTAGVDSTETGADGKLCRELIAGYGGFVAAYSRLFVLGTQLLIMETEQEQEVTLANPGAAHIVRAAHVAFHSLGGGALN